MTEDWRKHLTPEERATVEAYEYHRAEFKRLWPERLRAKRRAAQAVRYKQAKKARKDGT